ncbi:DUF2569 domain-containing protein [Citrobacter enshiensis]|uniref:DUF2569 domain-containing protein n=1 Tax=Citrobacter enshiensis TaxID=2971264 RepID=UPI0023E8217D|nr:DUF2569 domain-containing protein [Citrobacter enshiensis]WET40222.1 DUF2569 domain-containing protein [Citrobacter enshiensis]
MDVNEDEGLRTTCKTCGVAVLPPDDYCKRCADKKLTGIGGWLYITALFLILCILSMALTTISSVLNGLLFDQKPYRTIVFMEAVAGMVLLLITIYTTFLFFRKKRRFPNWFIFLLWGIAIFSITDIWVAVRYLDFTYDASAAWKLVKNALYLAIWSPYFRVSKRVKLTFVN